LKLLVLFSNDLTARPFQNVIYEFISFTLLSLLSKQLTFILSQFVSVILHSGKQQPIKFKELQRTTIELLAEVNGTPSFKTSVAS
jgi:hypothetical protein